MAKQIFVYRENQVIAIKAGMTLEALRDGGYFERHPDAVVCKGGKPSYATMSKWESEGIARAIDGCKVEPDGHCSHVAPLGYWQ